MKTYMILLGSFVLSAYANATATPLPRCYSYASRFSEVTTPVTVHQLGLKIVIKPKYGNNSLILEYNDSSKKIVNAVYGEPLIEMTGPKIRFHLDSASWGGYVDPCGNKQISIPNYNPLYPNAHVLQTYNVSYKSESTGEVFFQGQWRKLDDFNTKMEISPNLILKRACFDAPLKIKYADGDLEERCFEFFDNEKVETAGYDSDSWGEFPIAMDLLGGNVSARWVRFFESGKIQAIRFALPQWVPIFSSNRNRSSTPRFARFKNLGLMSPGVVWYGTLSDDADLSIRTDPLLVRHFPAGTYVEFDSNGLVSRHWQMP